MRKPTLKPRWAALTALAICIALISGGLLTAGPVAAQIPGPLAECPPTMSADQLSAGMTGLGYTVRKGRTVESFGVEVLGVIKDAIAPGRDLIVIDTSGEAIEAVGGIWFGMSGSPVYVNGKLIGAVAYGFSFGPSSVGGVTPIDDMLEVAGYPESSDGAGSISPSDAQPSSVELSRSMRTKIAGAEGTSTASVDEEMTWLRIPLSISGLSGVHRARLRNRAIKKDLPLLIPRFAGSSASADPVFGTARAGESFAGALSYGDITFAGVGTTTWVCQGKLLAFGHPFFFSGRAMLGANAADALTIVDDPVFGPYKLANVAEALGRVDQDRFAAIRALLGDEIPLVPVVQDTTALDTGKTRTDATTEVVQGLRGFAADYLPFISWIHAFANIDSVFDQIGPGSSFISWTIRGVKTSSGEPWALVRSNKWVSNYDISWGSTFELLDYLFILQFQELEKIEFSDIDIGTSVEETIRKYTFDKALWSKDGVTFRDVRRLRVRPGQTVFARVKLEASDDESVKTVTMKFRVPRDARRAVLITVSSGGGFGSFDFYCFFYGECGGGGAKSFDALLKKLQNAPRNDDLVGTVRLGRKTVTRTVLRQEKVVEGSDSVELNLQGGDCCKEVAPEG